MRCRARVGAGTVANPCCYCCCCCCGDGSGGGDGGGGAYHEDGEVELAAEADALLNKHGAAEIALAMRLLCHQAAAKHLGCKVACRFSTATAGTGGSAASWRTWRAAAPAVADNSSAHKSAYSCRCYHGTAGIRHWPHHRHHR